MCVAFVQLTAVALAVALSECARHHIGGLCLVEGGEVAVLGKIGKMWKAWHAFDL